MIEQKHLDAMQELVKISEESGLYTSETEKSLILRILQGGDEIQQGGLCGSKDTKLAHPVDSEAEDYD